ncbi:MAG: ATP-grasp domain-containing protein [Eubacterium sp.]|nr:ATP-grasp domain-containing protein [Eubacterium sp.]
MKTLMSLGGNYFQMTVVKAAKRLGVHVIDVDYLENNPAHKYADEYYNISTLDREAVLNLAREKQIDGIISYASDVSASTAAYVAEKLSLPGNPWDTVDIMSHKDRFRPFLKEKGFRVPEFQIVETEEDVTRFFEQIQGEILLKPVHASGSKGVSKISCRDQIPEAFQDAKKYSQGLCLIAEQFIQRKNYQIAGDAFVSDGKIVFWGIANEHFNNNCNPLVPIGESFPAKLSEEMRNKARVEVQRALHELGYKNGAVNLDFMFDENGDVWIIELGPRNGGNLITDAIKEACGTDLAEYTVKAALGEDIGDLCDREMGRYIASYIWHAKKDGIYAGISYSEDFERHILRSDMFVKPGDQIYRFENGSFGLGAALLQFDSMDQMLDMMDSMDENYSICYQ